MTKITGYISTNYAINDPNQTWLFSLTSGVSTNVDAVTVNGANSKVIVNGALHSSGGSSGLDVQANDVKVTVGATGVIAGGNGISADYANTSIVNHGMIEGVGNWSGIDTRGSSLFLDNFGILRGGLAGIYGYGPGHEVVNEKSGYIFS